MKESIGRKLDNTQDHCGYNISDHSCLNAIRLANNLHECNDLSAKKQNVVIYLPS